MSRFFESLDETIPTLEKHISAIQPFTDSTTSLSIVYTRYTRSLDSASDFCAHVSIENQKYFLLTVTTTSNDLSTPSLVLFNATTDGSLPIMAGTATFTQNSEFLELAISLTDSSEVYTTLLPQSLKIHELPPQLDDSFDNFTTITRALPFFTITETSALQFQFSTFSALAAELYTATPSFFASAVEAEISTSALTRYRKAFQLLSQNTADLYYIKQLSGVSARLSNPTSNCYDRFIANLSCLTNAGLLSLPKTPNSFLEISENAAKLIADKLVAGDLEEAFTFTNTIMKLMPKLIIDHSIIYKLRSFAGLEKHANATTYDLHQFRHFRVDLPINFDAATSGRKDSFCRGIASPPSGTYTYSGFSEPSDEALAAYAEHAMHPTRIAPHFDQYDDFMAKVFQSLELTTDIEEAFEMAETLSSAANASTLRRSFSRQL